MNRNTWILALVLGLGAWSSAHAGNRTWGDGTLPDYLAVFDVNGDGKLSVEEIQAMKNARQERHDDWLARWDVNGDGVIDDAERAAAQEALRQQIEDRRVDRFEEADQNGDGFLSYDEFLLIKAVAELYKTNPDAVAAIFDRLDADNDNLVSTAEFTARLRDHRVEWRTAETFAAADVDTNGCLSLAEFSSISNVVREAREHRQQPADLYNRLDADGDGCLTLEEFTAPIKPPAPVEPPHPGVWRTAETYAAADVDGNGCLTLAEFSAIPQVVELAKEHPGAPAMIYSELDADKDACLSLAEFTASCEPPEQPGDWRTAEVYAAADADGDGCLTLAEFSAIPAVAQLAQEHPDAPAMIFAQLDIDRNQCLSLAEFTAVPPHDGPRHH